MSSECSKISKQSTTGKRKQVLLSTSSAVKTPENTQDPGNPEPAGEGNIQMEYSFG